MAIGNTFSDTSAKSILELLQSKSKFVVPRFQRNYSWKTENVETLWSDLLDNFQSYLKDSDFEDQYLLGPIVLVNNNNKKIKGTYDIIDGQQRLATLTIIFCVARDIILEDIHKKGDISKPEGFEKIPELIQHTQMGKHKHWKLELNDINKDMFEEIQEYESNGESQYDRIKKQKPKAQSNKLLKENYITLHKKMTEALYTNFGSDKNDDYEQLDDKEKLDLRIKNHPMLLAFLTHVRENNYVIQILVSDEGSAFQIFETLNERGKTLSKSDLIKNYILNKIKDAEIQKKQSDQWNHIFTKIVGNNQQGDDDFIIESYKSRNCDKNSLRPEHKKNELSASKKNLYKIIKKMVNDQKTCKKFIKELEEDAEFLSMLNDPSSYDDESIKDNIYVIKALKAKSIRIPLLAAYRKWYKNDRRKEYYKLVKLLVKFFFKIRTVNQEHPGKIEEIINDVTRIINKDESFQDVVSRLKENDDRDDFKHNFEKKFMLDPSKDEAKYVLREITMHLGTKYDDVKPIDNLILEHILPREYTKWNVDDFCEGHKDCKIDEFVRRLGNMTLLKKAINSRFRNSSFELKRDSKDNDGNPDGYKSSSLKINEKTVCNHDKWTARTIKEREKEFIEYADKIWELK